MAGERLSLVAKDGRANLIRAFKATGCVECGRRYPELDWSELHVDHIDPRDKVRGGVGPGPRSIGHNNGGGSSVKAMLTELLGCQVLCHDCHKEKHRSAGALIEGQLSLFNGSGGWRYE